MSAWSLNTNVKSLLTANYDCIINCTNNIKNLISFDFLQLKWEDCEEQDIITNLKPAIQQVNNWIFAKKRVLVTRSAAFCVGKQ